MKKIKKLDNKGFSLIELLICLAISSFVILAAYSLVLVGTTNYRNNNSAASLQKEVSFATNILGESIRNGKCEDAYIVYRNSHKDIEIHTGKRVICYDESAKSLYIFDETGNPSTDYFSLISKKNLISKYVTSFNAKFVSKNENPEVAIDYTINPQTIKATEAVKDISDESILLATDIVKFEMTFEVDGRTDTTELMYQIRN